MMCRILGVSRSGYYAWLDREESKRQRDDRTLIELIKQVHSSSKGAYGAPRVYAELRAEGYLFGMNRIAKLMQRIGLKGCPRKRVYRSLRKEDKHPPAPNLLARQFNVKEPNRFWASDITYIHTRQGLLYLAVVMDLYSRKIVGWAMDSRMSRHLTIEALKMALQMRKPSSGLVHHSDRGAQYACDDYRELLLNYGIECSMSASGNCYDNAVVESFFGMLKRERIRRYRYLTRREAEVDIFDYIECFYNRKRRHGYLGYISPNQFEQKTLHVN